MKHCGFVLHRASCTNPATLLRYLTTGPIVRRAEDLWPIFKTISGPDGVDAGCTAVSSTFEHDPKTVDITQIEILVIDDLEHLSPFLISDVDQDLIRAYRDVVSHLKSRGCKVLDATQHNTTQHNTTQHNTTQHNTTQHNTTQHNTTQHEPC
jgi:Asp-tRNA(Asn)/Glu-tRNA(Gln) amidotransferase A subunit family amidase